MGKECTFNLFIHKYCGSLPLSHAFRFKKNIPIPTASPHSVYVQDIKGLKPGCFQ